MNSLFIYTAKRSLIPGHLVDQSYELEIDLMDSQPIRKAIKTAVRSLGGATETIYSRGDDEWSIQFAPVCGDQLMRLKEFLDSTESGNLFFAYLYGTEAEPLRLKRTDDGYSQAPFVRIGSESGDLFQFSAITAVES